MMKCFLNISIVCNTHAASHVSVCHVIRWQEEWAEEEHQADQTHQQISGLHHVQRHQVRQQLICQSHTVCCGELPGAEQCRPGRMIMNVTHSFLCRTARSGPKKMDNTRKRRRRHGNNRGGVSDRLHSSQFSGVCAPTRWAWPKLVAGCSTAHKPLPLHVVRWAKLTTQIIVSVVFPRSYQLTFVHVFIFIITLVPISY